MTRDEIINYMTERESVTNCNSEWDRHHEGGYWQSEYNLTFDQIYELEKLGDEIELLFSPEDMEKQEFGNNLLELCDKYSITFDKYIK